MDRQKSSIQPKISKSIAELAKIYEPPDKKKYNIFI